MKSWRAAVLLLLMTPPVQAREGFMPDFTGLMSALKQSAAVRTVIQDARCRLFVDERGVMLFAGKS